MSSTYFRTLHFVRMYNFYRFFDISILNWERMTINKVRARQIFDSRGNPTVEVDIITENGTFRASVPSGASTGKYESLELRDNDKSRYMGRGVLNAVRNVNEVLGPKIVGMDPSKQEEIDKFLISLDGTHNKGVYGANAILAISLAVTRAGAAQNNIPLYQHFAQISGNPTSNYTIPIPAFNVINGGSHAGNFLAFQEFLILPIGVETFTEAMRAASEVYHTLKIIIKEKYGFDAINVGDEGGFAPNIKSADEGLDLLVASIEKAGYTGKVVIAMDMAASEFYSEDGLYDLNWKVPEAGNRRKMTSSELATVIDGYIDKYPIVSVEDPFSEDDWEAFSHFKRTSGNKCQIVGDDLLVTNPKRIEIAIGKNSCNCLLLKVNQIGTITEAINACKMAQRAGWNVMVSHRSGETEDSIIADFAIGIGAGQIKTGAPCRSERLAKYNQVLRIEEELGPRARYARQNFNS